MSWGPTDPLVPQVSKLKFKSQLDRARSADLVQRIEAAALATGSEVVVQHLRGLAELGRGEKVDWITEVRMIQDIEEIASRLKRKPLGKAELSAHRQVPLGRAEAAQSIASQIALSRSGNRKCR